MNFTPASQQNSDLPIGPELKHSSGIDKMTELTRSLFLKRQHIFLDDVLAGWQLFARKGVAGILVLELHYGPTNGNLVRPPRPDDLAKPLGGTHE